MPVLPLWFCCLFVLVLVISIANLSPALYVPQSSSVRGCILELVALGVRCVVVCGVMLLALLECVVGGMGGVHLFVVLLGDIVSPHMLKGVGGWHER